MNSTRIVLNVHGGVVQELYCSDPDADVRLVDWDVEESDPDAPGIVEIDTGGDRTQFAYVGALPAHPLTDLAGTDVEQAIQAAGL